MSQEKDAAAGMENDRAPRSKSIDVKKPHMNNEDGIVLVPEVRTRPLG